MDSNFLRGFLLTVEAGSMSEAARRLGITPAAVAQQIKSLEKNLETSLITRSGRTVIPTPSGSLLAERAKSIIRDIDDLKSSINTNPIGGEFRLGSINTALLSFLPPLLKEFVALFPEVKTSIKAGHSNTLIQDVSNGDLDAAICLKPTFTLTKSLSWSELRNEPLVLLAPTTVHAISPKKIIESQNFIRYDRNLGGGKQAEIYLRESQINPIEGIELSSILSIAMMVEAGLGVSIVPDIQSPLIDRLKIKKIKLDDKSHRAIGVLHQKHSIKTNLIQQLVESYKNLSKTS